MAERPAAATPRSGDLEPRRILSLAAPYYRAAKLERTTGMHPSAPFVATWQGAIRVAE